MNRRSFLTGLIAAPVIIKYSALMPVKAMQDPAIFTSKYYPYMEYYWVPAQVGFNIADGRWYTVQEVVEGRAAGLKAFNNATPSYEAKHWVRTLGTTTT